MAFYAENIRHIMSIGYESPRGKEKQRVMHSWLVAMATRFYEKLGIPDENIYFLGHENPKNDMEQCVGTSEYSKHIDITTIVAFSIWLAEQVKAYQSSYRKNANNSKESQYGEVGNTLIATSGDIERQILPCTIEIAFDNMPVCNKDGMITGIEHRDIVAAFEYISNILHNQLNPQRPCLSLLVPVHVDQNKLRDYIGQDRSTLVSAIDNGTIPISELQLPKSLVLNENVYTDIDDYNDAKVKLVEETLAAEAMGFTYMDTRRFNDINPADYAAYCQQRDALEKAREAA